MSSENIWFNCSNKWRYAGFHCYSSCISAMGVYSSSAWCLRPAKSQRRNAECWSAGLPLGVCVFVFQCVKPLGLNIAGILSLFPFLPVSLAHSFSHALVISLLFLAAVPPWRRQQWPYCERWEMGRRPMMSSCHREERRERPPGVQSALFFPVVFRKAVINFIPSSSLCCWVVGVVKDGVRANGGGAEDRKNTGRLRNATWQNARKGGNDDGPEAAWAEKRKKEPSASLKTLQVKKGFIHPPSEKMETKNSPCPTNPNLVSEDFPNNCTHLIALCEQWRRPRRAPPPVRQDKWRTFKDWRAICGFGVM